MISIYQQSKLLNDKDLRSILMGLDTSIPAKVIAEAHHIQIELVHHIRVARAFPLNDEERLTVKDERDEDWWTAESFVQHNDDYSQQTGSFNPRKPKGRRK